MKRVVVRVRDEVLQPVRQYAKRNGMSVQDATDYFMALGVETQSAKTTQPEEEGASVVVADRQELIAEVAELMGVDEPTALGRLIEIGRGRYLALHRYNEMKRSAKQEAVEAE